jgi:hypothetical protein
MSLRSLVSWIVSLALLTFAVSCERSAGPNDNSTPPVETTPVGIPSSVGTPITTYLVIVGHCLNGDQAMQPATNALHNRQYVRALDLTEKALAAYHNCASVHTGEARVFNKLDEAAAWIYLASIHHSGPAKTMGDWKLDLQNAKSLLASVTSDPSANSAEKQWADTLRGELSIFQQHKMIDVPPRQMILEAARGLGSLSPLFNGSHFRPPMVPRATRV